jgi:multiple sugar transport system substrate-binding protein
MIPRFFLENSMKALTIRRSILAAAALAVALPMTAQARCDKLQSAKAGEINIIGATFPALQHIAKEMETCTQGGLKVSFKMSSNSRTETEQAFAVAGASPFDAAVISNGLFPALNGKGQLQPMTDLVEKYKAKYKIEENMLVRVNGQVMAIAFMQNSLNLFYRKDIFDKHGIKVPTTYTEMLAAAKVIKEKEPSIEFPIAQTFAKGWDSGKEFVDLYVGMGGKLFKAGSAQPDFNSETGVRTLELMKSMTQYMTPNYLASNSDDVTNQFQQGKAAMGVFWASRGSRMDDPAVSKVVGKIEFAAAPSITVGGKPASHMWWDGVVMPKNMKGDRETVFQVLMEALDEDTTKKGNDLATWVRSAYKPTRFATGVAANAKAGTPIWPTEPYAGLAQGELGKVVADALAGTTSAKAALDTAAAAYVRVATEQGYIK